MDEKIIDTVFMATAVVTGVFSSFRRSELHKLLEHQQNGASR